MTADRAAEPEPTSGEPIRVAERLQRDPDPPEIRGWARENLWSVQWW